MGLTTEGRKQTTAKVSKIFDSSNCFSCGKNEITTAIQANLSILVTEHVLR